MRISDKAGYVLVHAPTLQAFPNLLGGSSWWYPTEYTGEPTIKIFDSVEKARATFHIWCRGGVTKRVPIYKITREELAKYRRFLDWRNQTGTPEERLEAVLGMLNRPLQGVPGVVTNNLSILDINDVFAFKTPVYIEKMQDREWTRAKRREKASEFRLFQVTMTCQNSFSIFK